jgi:hypothetical protein
LFFPVETDDQARKWSLEGGLCGGPGELALQQ